MKKIKEIQLIKKNKICKNCKHYQVEKNLCKLLGGEIIQTLCCAHYSVKQNICEKCINKDICLFEKLSTFDNEEIVKCDKYQK